MRSGSTGTSGRRSPYGALAAAIAGCVGLLGFSRLAQRLQRETRARRRAEERLRGLLEQSMVGVCIVKDGRFACVNARFAEIFGYERGELEGKAGLVDLAAEEDAPLLAALEAPGPGGEAGERQVRFRAARKDGAPVDVSLNGKAVDDGGRPAFVGSVLDVTEQVRAQRRLAHLAFHDPLTELPNRALFYDRLGQALAQAKRGGERFGLLVLDLDGFKAVNDLHGHEAGDALLVAVGRRLRLSVRESDTVARMGGDEFVVLLRDLRDEAAATAVAGKILAALAGPFALGNGECRVGASIGVCLSPEDGEDMETLLGRADAAMYESKARGKNRFTRCEPAQAPPGPVRMLHLDLGPEMAVGVPVIDQQHSRMADLLNRVADAMKRGQDAERVSALLDDFIAFTRHHFETENRLMERSSYPGLLAHAQEHRRLLDELASIRAHADGAGLMLTIQSLREWLTTHISHGDRELGEALRARAAAGTPGS